LSNETEFEGRRHGVLTWYLAAALKAAPKKATYRDVMDQVKTEVSTRFPSQDPQLEGPGQDLVVFGTDRISAKAYVLVEPAQPGKARVEAGKAFGLGKGSTVKVYPPGTADFDGTKPTATLKISKVADFKADAEILSGDRIQPNSRALLEAVTFGDTSIPVFVQTKKQPSPLARVKGNLAEMQAIKLVDDESGARLIVKESEERLWVQSGDLELLVPSISINHPNSAQVLTDIIKNLIHWMVLLDLRNPNSKMTVGLELRRVSDTYGTPAPHEIESCPVGWKEKWKDTGELPPSWCRLTYQARVQV
jgi:hypothetical protein